MNYGKAIRVIRATRGMSQKKLAYQSKLDASYISLLESGRRIPSADTIETIAKALNVPVYLFSLFASDAKDLNNITSRQAGILAKQLLEIIIKSQSRFKSK